MPPTSLHRSLCRGFGGPLPHGRTMLDYLIWGSPSILNLPSHPAVSLRCPDSECVLAWRPLERPGVPPLRAPHRVPRRRAVLLSAPHLTRLSSPLPIAQDTAVARSEWQCCEREMRPAWTARRPAAEPSSRGEQQSVRRR